MESWGWSSRCGGGALGGLLTWQVRVRTEGGREGAGGGGRGEASLEQRAEVLSPCGPEPGAGGAEGHLCTHWGSSQSSAEDQHGGREGLSVRKGISQQGCHVQEGWCCGNFQKPDAYLRKSGCRPGPGVGDPASQKTLSLACRALVAAPEELTPQGQWDPGVFPGAPPPQWGRPAAGPRGRDTAPPGTVAGQAPPSSGPERDPQCCCGEQGGLLGPAAQILMVPDLERSLSLPACDWRKELAAGGRGRLVLIQPFLGQARASFPPRRPALLLSASLLLWGRASVGQPLQDGQRPHPLEAGLPLCTRLHPGALSRNPSSLASLPDSPQKRERPASPASLPRGDREDGREPLIQRLKGCAPPPAPAGSMPRPAGSCVTRGLWQSGCGCVAAPAPGAGGGPAGGRVVSTDTWALSRRGQDTMPGHHAQEPRSRPTSSAFGQFSHVTCHPDLGLDADPEPWPGNRLHWWAQGAEPGRA